MSSFPAMISNEPPPIDSDEADEEDFDDEFRSNGLHLDISADPSPVSSPRKPPIGSSNHNHKPSPLTVSNNHGSGITLPLINGDSIPPEEKTLKNSKVHSTYNVPEDEYLNVVNAQPEAQSAHTQTTSIITSTDGWEHNNWVDEGDEDLNLQDDPIIPVPCDQPIQEVNSLEAHQVPIGEEEEAERGRNSEAVELQVSFGENGIQESSEEEEAKTEDNHEEPLQGLTQDLSSGDSITENPEGSTKAATNEVQAKEGAGLVEDFEPFSSSNNFDIPPDTDALEDDDSFGEFGGASAPVVNSESEDVQKSTSIETEEIPDLFPAAAVVDPPNYSDCDDFSSNSQGIGIDDPQEDFGDFSSNFNSEPVPPQSPTFPTTSAKMVDHHLLSSQVQAPAPPEPAEEYDDDDFGDFASSGAKELPVQTTISQPVATPLVHHLPPTSSVPSTLIRRDSIHGEGRLDALVRSVFTSPSPLCLPTEGSGTILEPIDKQLGNSASNAAWTHIQEFEDSHCLLHKWPRSGVYHLLMKSLNIDSSNVIYSAKYGTIQVPKFAASLVDMPLQPQSVNSTPFDFPVLDGVPIGRLDDDYPEDPSPTESKLVCDPKLNKEAVRILEQLPDLSYMLAKTLVFPRHPNY